MKNFKPIYITVVCLIIFSCNRHMTVVYFNDTSKVDDGEIFGEQLLSFFTPDNRIYIRSIHSNDLQKELIRISDTLKQVKQDEELDDGYYGYAFITSSKDTLFADYSLSYWKSGKKRKALSNQKLKTLLTPIFDNPYLKK